MLRKGYCQAKFFNQAWRQFLYEIHFGFPVSSKSWSADNELVIHTLSFLASPIFSHPVAISLCYCVIINIYLHISAYYSNLTEIFSMRRVNTYLQKSMIPLFELITWSSIKPKSTKRRLIYDAGPLILPLCFLESGSSFSGMQSMCNCMVLLTICKWKNLPSKCLGRNVHHIKGSLL